MASRIQLSEDFIRYIAQNLRNILVLAEKTHYPFVNVKFPSSLTILNGVCDHYGFSSVKGMSEKLSMDDFDQSTLIQNPLNYLHSLRVSNPHASKERIQEAHIFILQLFKDLSTSEQTKVINKTISRLQAYRINPVVSNVMSVHDSDNFDCTTMNVKKVIHSAAQSIVLYHSQLHEWGTFESYSFELFTKGQKDTDVERYFKSYIDMLKTDMVIGSTSTLNFNHHLDKAKIRASFNNYNTMTNLVLHLRKNMLMGLMDSGAECEKSAKTLQSLMADKRFTDANLPNKFEDLSPEELTAAEDFDHPKYAELVLRAICNANGYILKKLSYGNGIQSMSHYTFDANGLLSPKHFPTVYSVLFNQYAKPVNFKFVNLNELYWAIQLQSAEYLEQSDAFHDQMASRYIRDIYNHFNLSAVVEEHVSDLQSEDYKAEYSKFRAFIKSPKPRL